MSSVEDLRRAFAQEVQQMPPAPQGVVDRAIANAQTARRRRRVLTTAGGVVALSAAVMFVPGLGSAPSADPSSSSSTSVDPGPSTTGGASTDQPPDTDEVDAAADAQLRAVCEATLATTSFPTWSRTSCLGDILRSDPGNGASDFELDLRFDAQCQWYAEHVVAVDTGQAARAEDSLVEMDEMPQWPGYAGTELGGRAAAIADEVRAGDLTTLRAQFSNDGAPADCSSEYLDRAAAWEPQ